MRISKLSAYTMENFTIGSLFTSSSSEKVQYIRFFRNPSKSGYYRVITTRLWQAPHDLKFAHDQRKRSVNTTKKIHSGMISSTCFWAYDNPIRSGYCDVTCIGLVNEHLLYCVRSKYFDSKIILYMHRTGWKLTSIDLSMFFGI